MERFIGASYRLFHLLVFVLALTVLWFMIYAAVVSSLSLLFGSGYKDQDQHLFSIALVVACLPPLYLAFRASQTRDDSDYALFAYLIRSAAHIIFSLALFLSAFQIIRNMDPAAFSGDLQQGRAVFTLALDNFLKVVLFDFLEVFEVDLSTLQPANTVGRIFVVLTRIVISFLIVGSVLELLSRSRFAADAAVAPSRGAYWFLGFGYVVAALTFAFVVMLST